MHILKTVVHGNTLYCVVCAEKIGNGVIQFDVRIVPGKFNAHVLAEKPDRYGTDSRWLFARSMRRMSSL